MLRVEQGSLGREGTVEIRVTGYLCFGKKGRTSLRGVFMLHSETGGITALPSALRALSYVVVLHLVTLLLRKMYLQN